MSAFLSCRRAVWSVLTVTAVTLAMVAAPESAEAAPSDGISGTVTSAGQPVQGIQVTACPTAGGTCGAPADTDVNGTYSVSGLAPGDYYVTFLDQTTAYVTQNYPNIIATTTAGPGTPVPVTLDHVTTGIDDVAVPGSTFSGIVTGAAGPLAGICVLPANADGYVSGVRHCTDSNGRYTTAGFPTGTYHLVFLDYEGRFLVPQWYDNLLDTVGQHTTATPLTTTTPPGNQILKNVVMQLGGNISGVATANGGPLANVYVTLFPTGSSGPGLYGAQTDGAGGFSTQSIPPGSYKIGFIDYDGTHLPANTYFYYNNAQTLATAATVTVTQGQTTALGVSRVPSVPTRMSATAADRAATVTFTAPASNGGSPITRYTLTPSPACPRCTGLTTTTTRSTVRGLTNGTAYTFRVTATNAVGTSPVSAPSASVTPRAAAAAITRLSDFNRDGFTDMVARKAAGTLFLYPGNGAGGFLAPRQIGTGWNSMNAIVTPGDVTGDGNADIIARDTAGRLWLYPGNGASSVSARRQIGRGWTSFTITNAANLNGAGRPDLLARDSAGGLWLYPLTGNAVFGARTRIGTGWNGYTIQGPGDFSGDNRADILARTPAGLLRLYRGNGTGGVTAGTQAGSGWQTMTALVTPGNWDRATGTDVLARDAAGRLWLYPGNNASEFLSRRQIGSGWQAMTYIG